MSSCTLLIVGFPLHRWALLYPGMIPENRAQCTKNVQKANFPLDCQKRKTRNLLRLRAKSWSGRLDSNQRPSAPKATLLFCVICSGLFHLVFCSHPVLYRVQYPCSVYKKVYTKNRCTPADPLVSSELQNPIRRSPVCDRQNFRQSKNARVRDTARPRGLYWSPAALAFFIPGGPQ